MARYEFVAVFLLNLNLSSLDAPNLDDIVERAADVLADGFDVATDFLFGNLRASSTVAGEHLQNPRGGGYHDGAPRLSLGVVKPTVLRDVVGR